MLYKSLRVSLKRYARISFLLSYIYTSFQFHIASFSKAKVICLGKNAILSLKREFSWEIQHIYTQNFLLRVKNIKSLALFSLTMCVLFNPHKKLLGTNFIHKLMLHENEYSKQVLYMSEREENSNISRRLWRDKGLHPVCAIKVTMLLLFAKFSKFRICGKSRENFLLYTTKWDVKE